MVVRIKTTQTVLEDQSKTSKPASEDTTPERVAHKPITAAHATESFAIDQAKKVSSSTLEHIAAYSKAKEDILKGALATLEDLQEDYGDDLLAWPHPDSTKAMAGNKYADKFTVQWYDTVARKNKTKNMTYYGAWFDATPDGHAIQEQMRLLDEADKEDKDENEYTSWSNQDRMLETGLLRQRRTNRINVVRKAMEVFFQVQAFAEHLPNVTVKFARKVDDKGKLTTELRSTSRPVILADVEAPENPEIVAVSKFLSFDAVKASKREGTLADVRASVKGKPTSGKGGADTSTKLPNLETTERWLNLIASQMETDAFTTQLNKRMSGDNGDDLIAALGGIFVESIPLFFKSKLPPMDGPFGKRYQNLLAQRMEQDESDKRAASK